MGGATRDQRRRHERDPAAEPLRTCIIAPCHCSRMNERRRPLLKAGSELAAISAKRQGRHDWFGTGVFAGLRVMPRPTLTATDPSEIVCLR